MFRVDVLSGYLICGVGSFVAVAMLRLARASDETQRQAMRTCTWCFAILGVSLMPAGLGPDGASHPAAQWLMTAGSLTALSLMARGIGLLQARALTPRWVIAFSALSAVACGVTVAVDAKVFAWIFTALLAIVTGLIVWNGRGFVSAPRDTTERLLGVTLALLCVSSLLRWCLTLLDDGPVRVDLMYVPPSLASLFAALYGVTPMVVATVLLTLVNARLRQQLRQQAQTDELTGTMTRRALRDLAPETIAQQHRQKMDVAVLMMDLDHFKAVNDTHGHAMGDRVLQVVAKTLLAQMRLDGLLARYGGEEFVVLIPVDGLPTARRVAERMRSAIADIDWPKEANLTLRATVSIGVAICGPSETFDDTLKRADDALYRAKHEGRNRCQVSLMVA